MSDYILAYDIGTTGNKATLFNMKGSRVGAAFMAYETLYPQPSWAEQRPGDWWDSVVATTREVLETTGIRPSEIAAVGLSGHMMGCLPVTDSGEPLANAMIHSDSRSTAECRAIGERVGGEKTYRITGQRLDPHYPLTKAMWLQKNLPGFAAKTRFLLQCKDYVLFRLTGRLGVTDFSDASLTALYDINSLAWSDELTSAAGLDSHLLPEVLPSKSVSGTVSEEAASQTGLCAGIPVVAGAGDGASATLGAGVASAGDAYMYVGGTSWIATLVNKPDIDPGMRLFSMGSVDHGRFCAIGAIQSAGSSIQWLAEEICREEKQIADREGVSQYVVMDRLAGSSVPGARNLYFLPYMMGERSPIWDPAARGVFMGLTLGHTRAELIRAVLEGVAYAQRDVLEVMDERDFGVESLRVIGGGAKSTLWKDIMATIFNRPLHSLHYPEEATSLGAALVAAVGIGRFSDFESAAQCIEIAETIAPRSSWVGEYEAGFAYFKSLYPALKNSFSLIPGTGH